MDSNAPLVSVITPFYNTANYIAECVESVLKQTYTNWEYILVNNCSTDNSVEVVDRYVRLHPGKIRLEHNVGFLSQLENFNGALRFVSPDSKYCKVVLADDWMFPSCLELMVDTAERDPSIGVVGAYSLEGRWVEFDGLPYPSSSLTGRAVCRYFFLENQYSFGSPTQLLLRSDLVLDRVPFYDEAYAPFADAAAIFDVLAHCNFGFVHQVLTFSRRDNASIMQSLLELDSPPAFSLLMLHVFGLRYLDPEEYRVRLKWMEHTYAQLLMEGIVARRGDEFWKFHQDMLGRMGYSYRSARTWVLFFWSLVAILLSPKRVFRLFYDGVRRPPGGARPREFRGMGQVGGKGIEKC